MLQNKQGIGTRISEEGVVMSNVKSCYAVIFVSNRTAEDTPSYETMAIAMIELAKKQSGFLDVVSVRDHEGNGITVSYWENTDAIESWKNNVKHLAAQDLGRNKWYKAYKVQICQVIREYGVNQ